MNQLGAERNFGVFKEPRGFIRVIQIIMAIFAFATTCDFTSQSAFTASCPGKNEEHKISFGYPFRLHSDSPLNMPVCSSGKQTPKAIFGDFSASSEFYVFVGVTNFLYCLGILILYVFFDEAYRSNDRIPKIDFGISAAYALLWLIGSAVWAGDVDKVKYYADPKRLMIEASCNSTMCHPSLEPNYGKLNVSLIFGFANVGLWASSLWFLWKETSWFSARNAGSSMEGQDQVVTDPGVGSQI